MKKTIEEMYDAKVQRWDKSSQSAKFGGFMHDAVQILINAKMEKVIGLNEVEKELVNIIKMLYRVEEKVFMPEPIDMEKAVKMGNDWKERMQEETNQQ